MVGHDCQAHFSPAFLGRTIPSVAVENSPERRSRSQLRLIRMGFGLSAALVVALLAAIFLRHDWSWWSVSLYGILGLGVTGITIARKELVLSNPSARSLPAALRRRYRILAILHYFICLLTLGAAVAFLGVNDSEHRVMGFMASAVVWMSYLSAELICYRGGIFGYAKI